MGYYYYSRIFSRQYVRSMTANVVGFSRSDNDNRSARYGVVHVRYGVQSAGVLTVMANTVANASNGLWSKHYIIVGVVVGVVKSVSN